MSILSTIMGVESGGGHNVPQGNIGDINNIQGTPAQGYFQITDPTWQQFGGLSTGYSSAIQAPYSVQLQVAQNIPIGRWGPATQDALAANGYSFTGSQTLGQVLAANGEDPNATVPADGASSSESFDSYNPSVSSASPDALSQDGYGDITGYQVGGVDGVPYDNSGLSNADVAGIGGPDNDAANPAVSGEIFTGGQSGTSSPSDQVQFNTAAGSPLFVTDAASIGQVGAQDVSKSVAGLSSGIQTAEAKAAATGTSWLNSIFDSETRILTQVGFIAAGLVVLLGAFVFFYAERSYAA